MKSCRPTVEGEYRISLLVLLDQQKQTEFLKFPFQITIEIEYGKNKEVKSTSTREREEREKERSVAMNSYAKLTGDCSWENIYPPH